MRVSPCAFGNGFINHRNPEECRCPVRASAGSHPAVTGARPGDLTPTASPLSGRAGSQLLGAPARAVPPLGATTPFQPFSGAVFPAGIICEEWGPLVPIALIVLHFQVTFIFNWRIIVFQCWMIFTQATFFSLQTRYSL